MKNHLTPCHQCGAVTNFEWKKTKLEEVLNEVQEERKRQDKKWGANRNHHPAEWLMILGEEVGEANKAALESHFNYPGKAQQWQAYRKELIQIAAVSVAMIESIDRKQP